MPLRLKKIIGSLAIFAVVLLWIFFWVSMSVFVPRNQVVQLLYYAIVGIGWCLPVMPILVWMEATKAKRPR